MIDETAVTGETDVGVATVTEHGRTAAAVSQSVSDCFLFNCLSVA